MMNPKLLCALMLGTKCLLWHKPGTILSEIHGYGKAYVSCSPDKYDGRKCAVPEGKVIQTRGDFGDKKEEDATECEEFHWDCAVLKKAIGKLAIGTEAEYSCTRLDVWAWNRKQKIANMSPLQQQNTNVGCWSSYDEVCR